MITEQDVYVAYRRAKSNQSGKGFRLPKDWDEFYATKMTKKNREFLDRTTGYFNTTWSNVNLDNYMTCGCDLYKTFSYHMFLRPNIIRHYIEQDKRIKRRIGISKDSIDRSMQFISDVKGKDDIRDG